MAGLFLKKNNLDSTERFGFEWDKYSKIIPEYEEQFIKWIYPFNHEDFKDKIILDAGCGMGRNSYWSIKWGAKKLVAFDYDIHSVRAAKSNLNGFSNAEVLYKNIYDINWHGDFDLIISIGVIHHLKDPSLAIYNLISALKSRGKLLIWVYGYEGNEWIVKLIDPIRKVITSRLPVRLVHILSYFCSVPVWIFLKIFKGPTVYLRQLSSYRFWHIHSIVFDQLIPKIAHYWKKEEAMRLLDGQGLKNITAYRVNNNSWTIIGQKI